MAKNKMDIQPVDDWKLYQQGVDYNHAIVPDYYATVARNWRVYNNQQWEGIDLGGLPMFILPMFQRIIRHFVASIMTSSVKMNYVVENIADNTEDATEQERLQLAEWLSKNSKDKWEKLKMDFVIRRLLTDGAMSGDMATYTYWDGNIKTGQFSGEEYQLDKDGNVLFDENGMPLTRKVPIMGDFITEAVDGVNVMFGNPNDPRVNVHGRPYQPYIIIAGREVVSKLRAEAKRFKKENGLTDDEINTRIVPDIEYDEQAGDRGRKELENRDTQYGKATYVIKLWADENDKIYFNKSVRNCYIRKDVDTELEIYPVTWANWDTIKNSYHGQAVATGLVSNQLEIDKAFAKLFKYLGDMAFPKVAYNKNVLPNGITNRIGEAIAVDTDEQTSLSNVIYAIPPAQIANKIMDIIVLAINQTMQLMGVSDAALGNANPENTSAIIALSKNSAVPLENVKASLYQMIEDIGYIWLEFELKKYKVPRNLTIDENGIRQMVLFDPSKLDGAQFRIKVDVMDGSYLTEGTLIRTMENLMQQGVIDAVQFIKRMPDEYVPDKEKLVAELEQKLAQQQFMQSEQFKQQAVQEFLQQAQQTGGENAGNPM